MSNFTENYKNILFSCGLIDYATDELAARFEELTALLFEANKKMNLTAIREEKEIILKHYADCLLTAHLLPEHGRLLDVGCGGGFPTLPLAIVRPGLSVTAVDSTAKKLVFVRDAAQALGLRVETLPGRAEDLGRRPDFREKFNAVTARAVAELPVLAEWCLPFVKVGGVFVAMKGASGQEELEKAKNAIKVLGGSVEKVEECTLGDASRVNVVVRKHKKTPAEYPRKNTVILRSPL